MEVEIGLFYPPDNQFAFGLPFFDRVLILTRGFGDLAGDITEQFTDGDERHHAAGCHLLC